MSKNELLRRACWAWVLAGLWIFCNGSSRGEVDSAPGTETQARPASETRRGRPALVESFDAAWGIIRDSYFDPTYHGVDWNEVREELRPKAEAARSIAAVRTVIEEMLARLGDSHMSIIPGEVARSFRTGSGHDSTPGGSGPDAAEQGPGTAGGDGRVGPRNGDLGMEVRYIEAQGLVTRVDPDGPAAKVGIRPGWILEEISGENVGEMLDSLPPSLTAVKREFMAWAILKGKLLGRPGSMVSLGLRDGADEPVVVVAERAREPGEPTKLGFLPTFYSHLESQRLEAPDGEPIGLIRFNIWMIPIVRGLDEKIDEFRHAEGIILDLRGNLGGLGGMILGVSGHFLKDRVSLGTLKMRGNELSFYANPRRVNAAGERVEPYGGPVAILIDSLSLSAAEIFAGGMQAIGRARVFGQVSGGQALPAIWDRLPDGDVLYHAFGDFVTAAGTRLEGHGVIPDETVPTRREDLLAGRDAPLQAAVAWIHSESRRRQTSAVTDDDAGDP